MSSLTTIRNDDEDSPIEPAVEAFLAGRVGADHPGSYLDPDDVQSELLPPQITPATGCILGERYRLETPLASGGMGSVWTARHIDIDLPVAIKLMATKYGRSPRERARFVREARAAAKLRSRNVVAVLDYGVDRGTPYIVMERLDGEDLWTRLARQRALPLPEVAKLLGAIGSALSLAHAAEIIHRDLKPENIFLARVPGETEEVVKVLDFGLAKELYPRFGEEATTTGVVVGTPQYMSPEQVTDTKSVDHRSDLWSVGVILYRALTGRLPFEGKAPIDVLNAVVSEPIRPPSSASPHLSIEVDRFFERALNRDPNARFQASQEMVDAFHRLGPAAPPAAACAPNQNDTIELTSGDFAAIMTAQVDAWACGLPARSGEPVSPGLNVDPAVVGSGSSLEPALRPEGPLARVWSRLSRGRTIVKTLLFWR